FPVKPAVRLQGGWGGTEAVIFGMLRAVSGPSSSEPPPPAEASFAADQLPEGRSTAELARQILPPLPVQRTIGPASLPVSTANPVERRSESALPDARGRR